MKLLSMKVRLILVTVFLGSLVAGVGWMGLSIIKEASVRLKEIVQDELERFGHVSLVHDAYAQTLPVSLHNILSGDVSWEAGRTNLQATMELAAGGWKQYSEGVTSVDGKADVEKVNVAFRRLEQAISELRPILESSNRVGLENFVSHTMYPALDPYRKQLGKLRDRHGSEALLTAGEMGGHFTVMKAVLGATVAVALVLAGLLAVYLSRMAGNLTGLVNQVHRSGIQVTTSVTEIAASTKQEQATATEVAATVTQIGATSKEISATAQDLVKTMNDVTGVAEGTAGLATSGQEGLTRMEDTMQQIMAAAAAINARLAVVSEKAGNITQVVSTINKVADQTNLLSLNASIEAEKAGEYGRGFAVVATEIRRLADQTAVATFDIEQMVKEMQSSVSAGVMGMDKFSEEVRRGVEEVRQVSGQLAQIIHQVQALMPQFESANDAMRAQAAGAQQISEALTQLSEGARQTAESLRQSNQAIDQLNEASRGLKLGVEQIRL